MASPIGTPVSTSRASPSCRLDSIVSGTASVTPTDRNRITDAGFNGFISKPVNLKEFLETVRVALEQGAA